MAEEAIPDEQSARDSEREDIRQIAEAEAPEPLRTLAADHGEYLHCEAGDEHDGDEEGTDTTSDGRSDDRQRQQ